MRILTVVFILAGLPASADVIRFSDAGSIFGGISWEITPDDRVVFSGYQVEGGFSDRAEWVWTDRNSKSGQITFAMAGAFARATAIVVSQGNPGDAPDFATDCTDAGHLSVAVDVPGLAYEVSVDNCIPGSSRVTGAAKRHYLRVRGVQEALVTGLGLDGLME